MLNNSAARYEEKVYLSTQYRDVERMPAWQDYLKRLVLMRQAVQGEILRGGLDKFGKDRTDEKRAVLHFMDNMIGVVPAIHKDYEDARNRMERQAEKAEARMERGLNEYVSGWSVTGRS